MANEIILPFGLINDFNGRDISVVEKIRKSPEIEYRGPISYFARVSGEISTNNQEGIIVNTEWKARRMRNEWKLLEPPVTNQYQGVEFDFIWDYIIEEHNGLLLFKTNHGLEYTIHPVGVSLDKPSKNT